MQKKLSKALKRYPQFFRFLKNREPFVRRILRPAMLYILLQKTSPLSDVYGLDRGRAIDRYYIEKFLEDNATYIKGRCLELLNGDYTARFGGDRVTVSDVLDIDPSNTAANLHGDLRHLDLIPDDQYDCIVLTQVLQFIDDHDRAVAECKRILKPGGALLITVPFIGRVDCVAGVAGDFWRFTSASLEYMLKKSFKADNIIVHPFGNVLAGFGFWIGQACEEFSPKQLDHLDENFPCIITAVAIK